MDISVSEISSIIKQQITDYDRKVEVQETGTVLSCGDGIARLHGLEKICDGITVCLLDEVGCGLIPIIRRSQ